MIGASIEEKTCFLLFSFLYTIEQPQIISSFHKLTLLNGSEHDLRYDGLSLYHVYGHLSPCARSSFAIVTIGFYRFILDWWTVGFADVDHRNFKDESLLLLGALGGSVSVAEDLLKKGADVNATGGFYGNALQAASSLGDEPVVRLLLDKRAGVNTVGGLYGRVLQAASYAGKESVVRLLLENEPNIHTADGNLGSALRVASYAGKKSVVPLLLDTGADVNAPGGRYGSALSASLFSGKDSVVQLLLEEGADVNAACGEHGSVLLAASNFW